MIAADPWSQFPSLEGHGVRLFRAEASHADALFAVTDSDTFRYFLTRPQEWTRDAFCAWFAAHLASPTTRAYVVLDAASGRVVGSTSFLDVDPAHRCVEIGATWYAVDSRGTRVNPACKLLMLTHAFSPLGCVRVTIKCNAKNAHSQAAVRKLGATYEGVLRAHRIQQDGTTRDTMYFSVLPNEWPAVRAKLQHRLEGTSTSGTLSVR